MRVIAGSKKGRRLVTVEGLSTRPTSDKVKEALFSIIQFELESASFLDLFAGSGQMGIEALSRGAEKAVFVEQDRKSADCIMRNLKALELTDKSELVIRRVEDFVKFCGQKFDIVFLDPPYNKDIIPNILPDVINIVNDGGVVICEIERGEPLPDEESGFALKRRYRYGKTEIAVYRKNDAETEIY